MRTGNTAMIRLTAALFAPLLGFGCASLETPPPQPLTTALPPVTTGPLAEVSRGVESRFGSEPSGFVLLEKNRDGLDWRLALADHAKQSLDMQYYVWDRDNAGRLLFGRLLDAAERGVRVRVLVDDFLFAGNDHNIATISNHPNIEIKIFNPGYVRKGIGSKLEFLLKFGELNRRMHNKVFVADGNVAVVGGRNVGDHYFGLAEEYNFVDLDVLVAGPVIEDIAHGFDIFWNSEAAYPAREMSRPATPAEVTAMIEKLRAEIAEEADLAVEAGFPLERHDWSPELRGLRNRWHPGTADFFYDEPVTNPAADRARFLGTLPTVSDDENPDDVIVVSPYLIPNDKFFASIDKLVQRGARVRVLVPSMGANNQPLVHSQYRQSRRRILQHGAELYELREDALPPLRAIADTPPVSGNIIGLHMKGYVRDREHMFIGSLNLDPRSIEINTEGGLWIQSRGLGEDVANHFEFLLSPQNAWRVTLDPSGTGKKLRWESRGEVRHSQPAPSPGARILDFIYGILPIRSQL